MRNRNSKLAPVLRAMDAFTAPAPAEPAPAERERQYKLDAATFAWTLAFRRWLADDTKPFPRLAPFVAGLASEDIKAFVDYALNATMRGLPAETIDEPTELELSPAGERAMAAIREQREGQGE